MQVREARCECGALKAIAEGAPARVSVCHCLECQRRTGSAFAYNATYPAEQVRTEGEPQIFERSSDEGFWVRRSFCPNCGSTVWYEIERRPGMITIPAGAFADPNFPEPRASVFGERKHHWIELRTERPISEE
jgi:hypothetical protein